MTKALTSYIEPLETDELEFLQNMESKDRKMYYKVYNIFMIMSFVIPFVGSWYRAFDGAPNAFSITHFFFSTVILLALSTAAIYISYRYFLRNVQADIKHKTKTIEICRIIRKQFMPQNNTYHIYIDARDKLSIEVSQAHFYDMNIGDEISLEFTTHSRLYLGYF
ncbi:MAG: hypothetical protein P4L41_17740 [Flavipsychrobacter sp.]|nr:hypothetical protein [Flavipsychrobacter sp.]